MLRPFVRPGEGITPVALHASLANVCTHTPCSRIGKTWSPCYLHASLAILCRRTPFSRTGIGGTPAYWHAVFSRNGKRGMPASLHAGLAKLCRCTPFLPKRGQRVRPFIYMPVLQIGAGIPFVSSRNRGMPVYLHAALKTYAGIPLFPRNGKRDTPVCLHANLPNLRNHMFPAVHVFLSHAGLADGCRHTPLFLKREKGIDLDISLASIGDRCQHRYFSRK